MRAGPEAISLRTTTSGVMLAVAGAVILIIYALFTGADLASPFVTKNLSRLF